MSGCCVQHDHECLAPDLTASGCCVAQDETGMQAEMVAVLIRIYAAFLINVELPAVSGARFTRPLTHSRTLWTDSGDSFAHD